MSQFELTNKQRQYFGLEPIEKHWDKIALNGDNYRLESILYFDGNTIKRHIVSTENEYFEKQYDELTKDRIVLLPKTDKGKEKKLTASVLEQRSPIGVYLNISDGVLTLGNYNTQTTFFSSRWCNEEKSSKGISEQVSEFIEQSPETHLHEIEKFKNSKRINVKYQSGDYFCFKLDRINFGFGRILLDVNRIRKKGLINEDHGLGLLMGPPLIVQLFAFKSISKKIDISLLDKQPKLPSDVMMDNLLLYGEYEIIGHKELEEEEFEFPISYGKSIGQRRIVFLQWGIIHLELPIERFNKYLTDLDGSGQNPYGYYSIGYSPRYGNIDIYKAIANNGVYDFSNSRHYRAKRDLRNPNNENIKNELFKEFGLDPNKSYLDNCKSTNTILTTEIIKQSHRK